MYRAFATDRGGVESAYFCEYIDVAAALTDIEAAAHRQSGASSRRGKSTQRAPDEKGPIRRAARRAAGAWQRQSAAASSPIHIEVSLGHPAQWEAKELLFDCVDLHYRALEFLRPKHRKVCMRRIFAIVASALGTLDARAHKASPSAKAESVTLSDAELQCLKRELGDTEAYFKSQATRRAQLWYFLGMTAGALSLGAIWLFSLIWASVDDPLLITMVAGGVGAVVSAMIRITRHQLVIDGEEGRPMTFVLGSFRPMTGAVFGVLLYALLKGGLITFTKAAPKGSDGSLYYAGLAFVAGFSERVAQVVVDTGARSIGGSSEHSTAQPR